VSNVRYIVAVNFVRGSRLVASAVIYAANTPEPSFSYVIKGRSRVAYLYRRGDRVPAALDAALVEHIKGTAVSCALIIGHPTCCPESAMALAVMRALELWVVRQPVLPALTDIQILIPTKKRLDLTPDTLKQHTHTKDWHTAAARALCRNRVAQETYVPS
jgi:hypothetical protein